MSAKNFSEVLVSFGKHAGKTIEEIPTSYLRWMCENVENKEEIVEAAAEELRWRKDNNVDFEEP